MPTKHPYLTEYLAQYKEDTGREPIYAPELRADVDYSPIDLVYPIGEALYVHIRPATRAFEYIAIEPVMKEGEQEQLEEIKEKIFKEALYRPPPKDQKELEESLVQLFDEVTSSKAIGGGHVQGERRDVLRYFLIRDIVKHGPLEPFILDPNLEDIQAVGTDPIHVIHKFFDMVPTNIRFPSLEILDNYIRNLSERIGRPVSDARPIVDATLADGSRINIVYSEDVSKKGPSFSIRRVHEHPISLTQLIAYGTLSAEIASYVWLCLENAKSVFVCGEAACGKSATLNALMAFIASRDKLYSAEDTPEIRPPHQVWQRLLTREVGPVDSRVVMFDLLRAALRSRPNYIVVGEIRGAEGAVAFQAMQTGHPTIATFHATDKIKMIQRLSSPPINIPLTFMDNLNVAIFQQAMYKDGRLIRRVTAVDEIQGYSELDGGIITLPVFNYDANRDVQVFKGRSNSFILEKKIAEEHGYEDPQQIYDELDYRAKVLQAMVDHEIFKFDEVNKLIFAYNDDGPEAMPFELPPPPEIH